jgi:hypothetical protein
MDDFKKVLSDNLIHRTTAMVSKPTGITPKALNISSYANIERCLGSHLDKKVQPAMEEPVHIGRLKSGEFSMISNLFSKNKAVLDTEVSIGDSKMCSKL